MMLNSVVANVARTVVSQTLTVVMAILAAGPALGGPLDTLMPGHWYEAPNTHMRYVTPAPEMRGSQGVECVIACWSGGAYDTKRDRLIVWGGGHGYPGNELYVFDLGTLRWSRVTEPSRYAENQCDTQGYYPDDKPCARHTYNFVEYVPLIDRFCSFGVLLQSDQPSVDCFNFDTGSWEKRARAPHPVTTRIGSKAVYDPWSKRVYLLTGLNARFSSYDPIADQWQVHSDSVYGQYYTTMAIDPKRKIILEAGAGVQAVWDLTQPKAGSRPLVTTGDSSITKAQAPGVQYDPVSERFVAWNGGADVFTLNMDTKVWTRVNPAATNIVTPPEPVKAGTYGRFRYVPSKNVFVVVNSVDQNVFFYKLALGMGPATPKR